MASVQLEPEAENDFAKLDASNREPINRALEKLTTNPQLRGMALSGDLAGWRKLVVGKRAIRIIFKYDAQTDTALVSAIGYRRNKEVYRSASTRTEEPVES